MEELVNRLKINNEPLISVFCNTYNQEAYISKCLEGFILQKTSFPFEVLITDDASSDSTPEIIRSYVERRPDLFLAVLHSENQLSKGINNNKTFLYPRARGKYIAFCEGDDYWTNPHKLQRQFEALETNPSATWCVHASANVNADTEKTISVSQAFDRDCILQFGETGEQIQLAATASFFVRRNIYAQYAHAALSNMPCHGDFKMSRFFSLLGDTVYLADIMSAYRVLAKNSINNEIAHSRTWREIVSRNTANRVAFLRALNVWSDSVHAKEIMHEINRIEYLGKLELKDYRSLVTEWPEQFSREPFLLRAKTKVLGTHPILHDVLRLLKAKGF